MNTAQQPNPIDVYVGRRIRARRKAIGVTQEQLAESLGLTFQQVQKYERGVNRVSMSKAVQIARRLGVDLAYLVEGLPAEIAGPAGQVSAAEGERTASITAFVAEGGLEIAEIHARLDHDRRQALVRVARALDPSLSFTPIDASLAQAEPPQQARAH